MEYLLTFLYVLGIALSIFLLYYPYKDVDYVNFFISSAILGTTLYSHIIQFYTITDKLFTCVAYLVVAVGACVGGVFDLLVPRLTVGISFGIIVSLLVSTILLASQKVESEKTFGTVLIIFIIFTFIGIALAFLKIGKSGDAHLGVVIHLRLSLFIGLCFAICVDGLFNFGLIYALSDIVALRVTTIAGPCKALSEHRNGSPCHIMSMIVLWVMTSFFSFFQWLHIFRSRNIEVEKTSVSFQSAKSKAKLPISTEKDYQYANKSSENYFALQTEGLSSNQNNPNSVDEVFAMYPGMEEVHKVIAELQSNYFRKIFGFQKDNLDNQMEHLFMLVCNESASSESYEGGQKFEAVRILHSRLFENYRQWCDTMGVLPILGSNAFSDLVGGSGRFEASDACEGIALMESGDRNGYGASEYVPIMIREFGKKGFESEPSIEFVLEIVDLLMYLNVWGESGNIRHLPEMLAFLFHKSKIRFIDELKDKDICPSKPEGYYLETVVVPVFKTILKEKNPPTHEKKIYDDFNEFFWTPQCLKYEVFPERVDGGASLSSPSSPDVNHISVGMSKAKKTYIEKRSWLHPLLSLNRLFEWHVVTFVVLMAWAFGSALQWSLAFTLQVMSSSFWVITLLHIFWTCLEVYVRIPGTTISQSTINGYLFRLAVGLLTLVYQSIYFHWAFRDDCTEEGRECNDASAAMRSQGSPIFWWWQYIWLSLLTLSFSILESITVWFPSLASKALTCKNPYVKSFLALCYPFSTLYVGKETHVPQENVFEYICFWITLLAFKLWFGYVYIISPVVVPTIELYDDYMNFGKISFMRISVLFLVWWLPHFIVYLIDLSIFYSVWAAIAGGFVALFERQGAVRDIRTFKKHFLMSARPFFEHIIFPREYTLKSSSSSLSYQNQIDGKKENGMTRRKSHFNLLSLSRQSSQSVPSDKDITESPINDPIDLYSDQEVIKAFSKVWNEIIKQLRVTDHINNAEKKNLEFFIVPNVPFVNRPNLDSKPTEGIFHPLYVSVGLFENTIFQYTQFVRQEMFSGRDSRILRGSSLSREDKKIVLSKENSIEWDKKSLMEKAFTENLDKNGEIPVIFVIKEVFQLVSWSFGYILRTASRRDCNSSGKLLSTYCELLKFIAGEQDSLANRFLLCKYFEMEAIDTFIAKIVVFFTYNKDDEKNVMKILTDLNKKGQSASNIEPQSGSVRIRKTTSNTALKTCITNKINEVFKGLKELIRPYESDDATASKLHKILDEIIQGVADLREDFVDNFAPSSNLSDIQQSSQFNASQSAAAAHIVTPSNTYEDWEMCDAVFKRICAVIQRRTYEVEVSSAEAKRRIHFFINSLFMTIPHSKSIQNCKEYTVLTPYYTETGIYSFEDLDPNRKKRSNDVNKDIYNLLYLKTLYKNDWANYLERKKIKEEDIWRDEHIILETRIWASLRGQTLFRTVEGIMYTEKAIELYCELERLNKRKNGEKIVGDIKKLKFNYVVACQVYGEQSAKGDPKAKDIDIILERHRNIRVAYLEKADDKVYSVLVKYDKTSKTENKVGIVYKIRLPGNPFEIGEGKPENQNHAIVFTRGRYLQAIDMNQDAYFEESLKFKNLLEEFTDPSVAILGFREHIFTGSESNVANYLALQELSFVTLGQRVLHRPLCIRQHYGHPDFFDKFFVMTQGGMSKASKSINLSEDVFAGYNATIRGKFVKFKEYCQIGKGRDQSLQAIYVFEGKLSQGNAEQSLSRDINRIANRLDFFRLLSFYYGGIGHYISNTVIMIALIVVTYTIACLALFYEEGVNGRPLIPEGAIQILLSGLGIVQTLPLAVTLTIERGFLNALLEIVFMILSGGPLYFIFHIQTKCYNFQKVLMAGDAKYLNTGRGFVTKHFKFDVNWRVFGQSHICLGVELLSALCIYAAYSETTQYAAITWSLWLTVVAFILGPFWFNPLTFDFSTIKEDYSLFMQWMTEPGGKPEQSWASWFKEEVVYLNRLSTSWKFFYAFQKCFPWIIVGIGLLGSDFFHSHSKQKELIHILILFVVFFVGHHILWLIEINNRYDISYGVRRFASVILSTSVFIAAFIMFFRYHYLLRYSLAIYYFGASFGTICLLNGEVNWVIRMYMFHDYIVSHALFVILSVLTLFQIGHLQTWLLYYNALSKGVVLDDILSNVNNSNSQKDELRKLTERIAEMEPLLQRQNGNNYGI